LTRFLRIFSAILFLCLLLLTFPTTVCAVPPLPSSLYGTVTFNGATIPDGTSVEALISGMVYATTLTVTYEGKSVYALDVPGDDPGTDAVEGGREGDLIQFKIGGIPASQTAVWRSGTNVNLDLAAESVSTPLPPQPTPAAPPSQTPIILIPTSEPAASTAAAPLPVAAASQTATIQAPPLQGTRVNLPAVAQGAASSSPQPVDTENKLGKSPTTHLTVWWVAVPAAVLLVVLIGIGLRKQGK